MAEDDEEGAEAEPRGRGDEDRQAILARRSRLVALAFSGLTGAAGCYESHTAGVPPAVIRDAGVDDTGTPLPCLERPLDAGPEVCLSAPLDAGPEACLGAPLMDAGPAPCLDIAPIEDAGSDAGPTPCLYAPLDAGSDGGPDAEPTPCLSMG